MSTIFLPLKQNFVLIQYTQHLVDHIVHKYTIRATKSRVIAVKIPVFPVERGLLFFIVIHLSFRDRGKSKMRRTSVINRLFISVSIGLLVVSGVFAQGKG